MTRILLTILATFLASAALAQDEAMTRIGDDEFMAGSTVVHDGTGVDDLFMAGESVTSAAPIDGTAHLAGRKVTLAARAGEVYAAGMEVTVTGQVIGDASLAGYDVQVEGAVGGDLRASGANVTLAAPVAGYASLAGDEIRIDSAIAGEAHIAGRNVIFGPRARVDGKLTLYEKAVGQIEVPETVVPAERITRVKVEEWGPEGMPEALRPFSWWQYTLNFLGGVIFIAILAALIAALLPGPLAGLRRQVLAAPLRSVWFGFLALSTLSGAAILLAMTLIGLLITPAAIIAALLAGFVGYVIGAYALGVGLMLGIGRGEPQTFGARALAAAAGALVAGVIGLIPFLGWLFVLAVTLAGVGALTLRQLRPAFFVRTVA
ncbi:hypothetical protein [Ostreiculturibacter nitratireducens]|uniref:hypothetical protein n=1 Tax=Ostreiculturibacter nitratireducens TaxID=3075226 RepID=UPI0031B5B2DF